MVSHQADRRRIKNELLSSSVIGSAAPAQNTRRNSKSRIFPNSGDASGKGTDSVKGRNIMHLLIALAYLTFDLFRNANPLTIGIAVIFVLLALRPRRRYRSRHRY